MNHLIWWYSYWVLQTEALESNGFLLLLAGSHQPRDWHPKKTMTKARWTAPWKMRPSTFWVVQKVGTPQNCKIEGKTKTNGFEMMWGILLLEKPWPTPIWCTVPTCAFQRDPWSFQASPWMRKFHSRALLLWHTTRNLETAQGKLQPQGANKICGKGVTLHWKLDDGNLHETTKIQLPNPEKYGKAWKISSHKSPFLWGPWFFYKGIIPWFAPGPVV